MSVSFYSSLPLCVQCFFFFFFQSCPTGRVPRWNPRCGQALRSLRLHSYQVCFWPCVCGGLSHDIYITVLLLCLQWIVPWHLHDSPSHPPPSPSPPQVLFILTPGMLLALCLRWIVPWQLHNSSHPAPSPSPFPPPSFTPFHWMPCELTKPSTYLLHPSPPPHPPILPEPPCTHSAQQATRKNSQVLL